jgi:hypothetical protein
MDRIWAESQLALSQQGTSNTTNFSSASVTAQTETGSAKVQAAPNEQLLPSRSRRSDTYQSIETRQYPSLSLSPFFYKCRSLYVQIKVRTCAYFFHTSVIILQSLPYHPHSVFETLNMGMCNEM